MAAGQREFGEKRDQEALGKWPALLARHPDIRLHGEGRLQSNKAAEAVKLFDVIHSVDRASLLAALIKESAAADRTPSIMAIDPPIVSRRRRSFRKPRPILPPLRRSCLLA